MNLKEFTNSINEIHAAAKSTLSTLVNENPNDFQVAQAHGLFTIIDAYYNSSALLIELGIIDDDGERVDELAIELIVGMSGIADMLKASHHDITLFTAYISTLSKIAGIEIK